MSGRMVVNGICCHADEEKLKDANSHKAGREGGVNKKGKNWNACIG